MIDHHSYTNSLSICFACVDVLRLVGDEKRVGGIKKEMPIIKPANAFEGGIH